MKKSILKIPVLILTAALVLCCAVTAQAADLSGARTAIAEGAEREAERISLEEYNLSSRELESLYGDMDLHNELPWYVDGYQYSYNMLSDQVTSISPVYLNPEQYDRDTYEQKLVQILEQTVLPGMSQWQIALSIHDYLAVHCEYDNTLVHNSPYDLLVNGTAVCDGYSRAYQDLLELAGLECILCISEDMDHSWNMVQLGGKWYHVDVTWDDPIPDCQGRAMHQYFLLDDATISDSDHNHYNWERICDADDPGYAEGMLWSGIESPICFTAPSVGYFRADDGLEHRICRWDAQTGQVTELVRFDAGAVDLGFGSYHYPQYGLSLQNGRLYYCDMEHVYSIDMDGAGQTVEFSWNAAENGTCITGAAAFGSALHVSVRDHAGTLTAQKYPLTLPDTDSHTHSYQSQTVPAGCETEGYTLYSCACGDSYTDDPAAPTGHDFCIETQIDDVTVYTCSKCGATRSESVPGNQPHRSIPLHQLGMVLWAAIVALFDNRRSSSTQKPARREDDDEDWYP